MFFRVSIDCGGTFTDAISVDEMGKMVIAKEPTTPEDLLIGVKYTLSALAHRNNMDLKSFLEKTRFIVHGTTLGTNTIVQKNGAKIGLIITKGYRDILVFRRIPKEDPYNWRMPYPKPLVPRYLRVEVEERLNYKGEIVKPLNEDSVHKAVSHLKREGVEGIVVSLFFSFMNLIHEKRVAEIIEEDYPEVSVSLSSKVLPSIGEFERTSTTVIDAYIAPVLRRYILSFQTFLEKERFEGQLLFMQNNGGVETWQMAMERPSTLAFSGPAASPVSATVIGKIHDVENLVSVDMGGTSFDCGIVDNGTCPIRTDAVIADQRFSLPIVDVSSIGAGGGSIAWFDSTNTLHVGPQSAGASPGPACYDRGGEEATVTDANVVLGYISPDYFLGGEMKLRKDLSEKAIKEKVADRLGISIIEAAAGIYKIINAVMADKISYTFTRRGYDVRDFTFCVGGSAGPVHAVRIMQELGLERLIIPKLAPVYSAYGMLSVDLKHDYMRFYYTQRKSLDFDHLRKLYEEMEGEAIETLKREGVPKEQQDFMRFMDVRYHGQFREVEVPWPNGPITEEAISSGIAAFHAKHREMYGYSDESYPIEFMNFKLSAIGKIPYIELEEIKRGGIDPSPALKGERDAFFEENNTLGKSRVYDGDRLLCGNILEGPCIVEEKATTIVIPPEFRMTVDQYGNYVSVK